MVAHHSLIVSHSQVGLTVVYDLRNGEQYTAQFTTCSHLLNALTEAGTSIIRDNHLFEDQLRVCQDVVTNVQVTTSERLVKAGFIRELIIFDTFCYPYPVS